MDQSASKLEPASGRQPSSKITGQTTRHRPYTTIPFGGKPSRLGTPGTWRGGTRLEDYPVPWHEFISPSGELTGAPSKSVIRKWLLDTYKDPDSPFKYEVKRPAEVYEFPWNGRQVREGRRSGSYVKWRNARADEQRVEHAKDARTMFGVEAAASLNAEASTSLEPDTNADAGVAPCENPKPKASEVLKGVRAYINGYLEGTTDIAMKQLVLQHSGVMVSTHSAATHILTSHSSGISRAALKGYLRKHPKDRVFVVRPQWVYDSITEGKKVKEWEYTAEGVKESGEGRLSVSDGQWSGLKGKKKEFMEFY